MKSNKVYFINHNPSRRLAFVVQRMDTRRSTCSVSEYCGERHRNASIATQLVKGRTDDQIDHVTVHCGCSDPQGKLTCGHTGMEQVPSLYQASCNKDE